MQLRETVPFLPPLLQLTRVHNYGAAWSSFSGARLLLIVLTAAGMGLLIWLLVRVVRHPLGQWALACVIGGGVGNLIDRVRSNCNQTFGFLFKSNNRRLIDNNSFSLYINQYIRSA